METIIKETGKESTIPMSFTFEDGCEFLMHGKNYDMGWEVSLDFYGKFEVTCPHGFKQVIEILP